MAREQYFARSIFAAGLIGLGVLSVIYCDFAYGWQPVPDFHPGRQTLAVVCGLFMICAGLALHFRVAAAISVRAVFPFLIAWLCLKIPAVIVRPRMEGTWLGLGEIGMLLAGGWTLFADLSGLEAVPFLRPFTGQSGIRAAQILFGLAVLPVGLGHIWYSAITASMVPAWLPFRLALAYITGFAQIACGLALLLSVFPRVAAFAETVLLALFAFLVWGPDTWFASTPRMAGSPAGPRFPLTAFLITWVIAGAALLVAAYSPTARTGRKVD